jgi:hypothetical protein
VELTAWVVALVTALAAGAALIGYAAPESGLAKALPLSELANIRASRLLEAEHPTARQLAGAEAESRRALALSPADSEAWARLAYIDSLRHPPISAAGLEDLKRSYRVAPLGPDISRWRVRFALERWRALSPDLRTSVEAEIPPLWWRDQAYVEGLPDQVNDPDGRVAITLDLLKLRAAETVRHAHHR